MPDYLKNNQFINTFNVDNYERPNSITSSVSTSALDQRYLKKISDDETNYKLTMNNLAINKIDKTYKEYGYSYYSYLDFSSGDLGNDASGNNRNAVNYSALSLDNYNGRTYVCQFSQTNTSSTIPETSTSLVQRLNYNNYISDLITKDNISFSFWYYHVQKANTNCIMSVGSKNYINHHFDVWNTATSNNLNARIRYNNNTQAFQLSANLLVVDTWNFVVISLGTNGAKMYLNNVLVSSDPSTATLKTLNSISPITDFNIGASLAFITTGPQYRWMFNGYLTDFIIWDTYLSDTTFIDKLYNGDEFGYKVVVLAGQSNCLSQGRGVYDPAIDDINLYPMLKNRTFQFPMTNLDASYNVINNSIIQANNTLTAWNPQTNTMNGFIQFCDKIITTLKPREKLLLVPSGMGGTGFTGTPNWHPNTPNSLYDGMVNATNYVLNMSSLNKLICFTWLQGEQESSSLYGNYLNYFYNSLKNDMLQFNNVPFIMGEIRPWSEGKAQLNNVLRSFANNTNRFLVRCGDLAFNSDETNPTHYNAESQRIIGSMFGDCYVNYITGVDINKSSFFTDVYSDNLYINNNIICNNNISAGSLSVGENYYYTGSSNLTTPVTQIVANNKAILRPTAETKDEFYNDRKNLFINVSKAPLQQSLTTVNQYAPTINASNNNIFISGSSSIGCVSAEKNYMFCNHTSASGVVYSMNAQSNVLEVGSVTNSLISNAKCGTNLIMTNGSGNEISNVASTSNLISTAGSKPVTYCNVGEFALDNNSTGVITNCNAIVSQVENNKTITNNKGANIRIYNYSGGLMTENIGLNIITTNNASATITDNYGLKIDYVNNGTISNNINIYSAGGVNSKNIFDGLIQSNNVSVVSNLSVGSGSTLASNLTVGSGATLMSTLNVVGDVFAPEIKFASDQNFLNYYKEGTFTAEFVNSPLTQGTATYTNNNGHYTRIGRVIYFMISFIYTLGSGARLSTNNIEINFIGIPKPTSPNNYYTLGYCVGLWPDSINSMVIVTQNANENVKIRYCPTIYPLYYTYQNMAGASVGGTYTIQFSGFYFV